MMVTTIMIMIIVIVAIEIIILVLMAIVKMTIVIIAIVIIIIVMMMISHCKVKNTYHDRQSGVNIFFCFFFKCRFWNSPNGMRSSFAENK